MGKKKEIKDYLELGLTKNVYWDDINFPKTVVSKSYWKCKICGFRWPAKYNKIQQGRGCPKCYGNLPVVVEDYLKLGLIRNVYWDDINLPKNAATKSYWKCKKCSHRWLVTYSAIKNSRGCPKCGRIFSEETKKKMSEVKLGKYKGKNNPFYGKKHTEESKKKQSEIKVGKYCGSKHPNWNPNLTDEERENARHISGYKEWTKAVYERDNYTCQICKKRGTKLNAHHLEAYNSNKELRTTVSNGITLCEKCHKDFHHNYGYGNNTREQFNKYTKEINKWKIH